MVDKTENSKVNALMVWIRLLLPVTIAALGWYIGQTVNGLDDRLDLIEIGDQRLELEITAHLATDSARHIDIQRRLANHELTFSDMVQMTEYLSRMNSVDKRFDRIENRLDDNGK
jgi:hypothetical protein